MNKKPVASPYILLVYIVIVALYHFFGYAGHFGFDDLHYAELAYGLLNGNINLEDHYAYRFTVILFTSLSYWVFGISDFSSSLPAMLVTFTILIIVFNILMDQGPEVTIIGLSLCTFSNWFLFYSDKLMPDMYVVLSVISVLAIINRYKYGKDKRRTFVYAFLLAFSLLFGFVSKGSIVLIIPLLAYLIITDIILKRDLKFWAYSSVSGIGLLAIYFIIIWIFTGDPTKRFDAIAHNSYLNLCSYDQQSLRILLKRILTGFFALSIYQSLATGIIFAFAFLFQKKSLRFFRLNDSFSFFMASAVILFLSSNFMTISPTAYVPMCLDPRHYLFLIPVAAIPASQIIYDFLTYKKTAIQIFIALFCIALISSFIERSTFWKLYLPLFGLFTVYYLTGFKRQYQQLFIILFAIILLLIPLDMVRYAQQVKYRKQRKLITEQVLENREQSIIVCNEVQKRLLGYFTGFDPDQVHRFLSFDDFESDTAIDGKKLILLNGHTRSLSSMSENDLPFYVLNLPPVNKLLFENKDLDISLYELNVFAHPGQKNKPLLETFNDFENEVPYWKQNDQDLASDTRYAGSRSNLVSKYSVTFDYPLNSLQVEESDGLLVQCSLFCYALDKGSSKIIVSIENGEGPVFWKALEIDRYIKAYTHWWPVSFDVSIPKTELKSDSRLKVYVWNNDKPAIYIDNFRIKIIALPVT